MAKQEQQSNILAKLGNRLATAFEAHKHDDTEFGQVELPAGIRGGIAKITTCGFGEFKNGEHTGQPYFRASASVLDPVTFTDSKGKVYRTQGGFTSIGPEPLCDTPKRQGRKTLDEHVSWMLNELRKMGVDTANLQWNQLETVCGMLVNPKNPVYVRFDTFSFPATEADPNPRINHKWLGPASAEEAEAAIAAAQTSEAQDDTTGTMPPPAARPNPNGNGAPPHKPTGPVQHATQPQVAAKAPAPQPSKPKPAAPKPAPAPEPEPDPDEYVDDGDVFALAARADAGDTAAVAQLAEQARSLGITDDEIAGANTWADLANQMAGGQGEDASADEAVAGAEWQPQVDEIYLYKPIDPKTKKQAAKAVDCQVVSVNAKARTVDLKNHSNPKLKYGGISWDSLEGAEE